MAMQADHITQLIHTALPNAQVTLQALVDDGDHYAVTVVSPLFAGKSRVQQHQMVYQALEGYVGGKLHALSVITKTP
jgi:stress-induced morphogen